MPRMLALALSLALCLSLPPSRAAAQDTAPLQTLLQTQADEVASPGRQSVGSVIEALVASGLPQVPEFLNRWSEREVVQDETTGLFYYDGEPPRDIDTGEPVTLGPEAELDDVRPNGGVRRVIATALVQFQLSDPDIARRIDALDSISRNPEPDQLEPLRSENFAPHKRK